MLQAIKEIGDYVFESKELNPSEKTDLLKILCDPLPEERYPKALIINFGTDDGKLIYNNVEVIDNQDPTGITYLFKSGSSAGSNFTPTYLASGDDIEKAFKNRIDGWFKKISDKDDEILISLKEEIELKRAEILTELTNKASLLDKTTGYFVSLCIDGKYLKEHQIFQQILIESSKAKLEEISFKEGICALSGEKGEVFSKAFPFTFYTLDKPGFITAGFNKKTGWKAFPYSYSTYLKINNAKNYLDENLSVSFAGVRLYVIPSLLFGSKNTFDSVMHQLEQIYHKKIKSGEIDKIHTGEAFLEDIGNKQKDNISLHLLFYDQQMAKFVILRHVQDILPSRFSQIFMAVKKVNSLPLFNDIPHKKEYYNQHFKFVDLRNFMKDKYKDDAIKPFLTVMEKIFKSRRIEYRFIIKKLMSSLRPLFLEEELKYSKVLQSLQIILILNELNLFSKQTYEEVQMANLNKNVAKAEEWFMEFSPDTFATNPRKAIFLAGALTQRLLNIQKYERGSAPFRSKLKGLRMNEGDIRGLIAKVHTKLDEYGAHYYTKLENVLMHYLGASGTQWKMTIDEINYMFLLGMNLYAIKDAEGNEIFKFGETENKENENE